MDAPTYASWFRGRARFPCADIRPLRGITFHTLDSFLPSLFCLAIHRPTLYSYSFRPICDLCSMRDVTFARTSFRPRALGRNTIVLSHYLVTRLNALNRLLPHIYPSPSGKLVLQSRRTRTDSPHSCSLDQLTLTHTLWSRLTLLSMLPVAVDRSCIHSSV